MEADNISFVTSQIDKGLSLAKKHLNNIEFGKIFNADNESRDGTEEMFKETHTYWPKQSIKTINGPGKGKNIFAFFREAAKQDFDVFLTIDADLKSIEPDWIVKFIEPFLDGRCNFVSPLYERSRFEGSTTNNFAYPLIYSFFGKDIRQPIAGDFALSKKLVQYILSNNIPKQAEKYGVDILLTMRAARFGGPIKQIRLNQKIHKPSFSKLMIMFPEIASSAIDALKDNERIKLPIPEKQSDAICFTKSNKFVHFQEANNLMAEQKKILQGKAGGFLWIDNAKKEIIKNLNNNSFYFGKNAWSDILTGWIIYSLQNNRKDSLNLSNELSPFFVLRAVHFWNKAMRLSPKQAENEVKTQARLIREKISNQLN